MLFFWRKKIKTPDYYETTRYKFFTFDDAYTCKDIETFFITQQTIDHYSVYKLKYKNLN